MNVAYVSGPYLAPTTQGIAENIWEARQIALALWRQGWAVICPHMNTAHCDGAIYPDNPVADRHAWLRGDIEFVNRLIPGRDALVMSPRWRESSGAKEERAAAINRGVMVYEWPDDEAVLAVAAQMTAYVVLPMREEPDD